MAFYLIASPIPPLETVLVFMLALLLLLPFGVTARRFANAAAVAAMLAMGGSVTAAIWCCCHGWTCFLFP